MTIHFTHNDIDYQFGKGDPILVHAILERPTGARKEVTPIVAEVETLATPGRYIYARGDGKCLIVPWDGFTAINEENMKKKDPNDPFVTMPHLGRVSVQADGDVLCIRLVPGGPADIGRCLEVSTLIRGITAREIDAACFGISVAEPEFVQEKLRAPDGGGFWRRLVLTNPIGGGHHTHDMPGPFSVAVHRREDVLGLMVRRETP